MISLISIILALRSYESHTYLAIKPLSFIMIIRTYDYYLFVIIIILLNYDYLLI